MLGDEDIDYLRQKDQYSDSRQTRAERRKAIRERVYNTMLDFTLLFDHLDRDEREKIFGRPPEAGMTFDDPEFEEGLRDTLAFILYGSGVTDMMEPGGENLVDPTAERLLENALYRAGRKVGEDSSLGPFLVEDVDLKIEATRIPDTRLLSALEEGRELHPSAVRMLLEMEEVDIAPIQEELRKMLLEDTDDEP